MDESANAPRDPTPTPPPIRPDIQHLPDVPDGGVARPTGLTVLAVMNFIFGSMGLLSGLFSLLMLPFWDSVESQIQAVQQEQMFPEWYRNLIGSVSGILTKKAILAGGVLSLVSSVLLFISGSGYLRQQRFRGRTMGNVYAGVALCGVVLGFFFWNLGMLNITELIYPVFTLVLLNFVFQNDFVH